MSSFSPPDVADLAQAMARVFAAPSPDPRAEPQLHALRLMTVAALCAEAFERAAMRAALVGGGAIEAYEPGTYTTGDIDLVVARHGQAVPREALDGVLGPLGFVRGGARHWERGDVLLEVPNAEVPLGLETRQVGPWRLPMVSREEILVQRLVGYDQTGDTGHGAQAVLLLRRWQGRLDPDRLNEHLRRERAGRAYAVAERLARALPSDDVAYDEGAAAVAAIERDLAAARDAWRSAERRGAERGTGNPASTDPDLEPLVPPVQVPPAPPALHAPSAVTPAPRRATPIAPRSQTSQAPRAPESSAAEQTEQAPEHPPGPSGPAMQ